MLCQFFIICIIKRACQCQIFIWGIFKIVREPNLPACVKKMIVYMYKGGFLPDEFYYKLQNISTLRNISNFNSVGEVGDFIHNPENALYYIIDVKGLLWGYYDSTYYEINIGHVFNRRIPPSLIDLKFLIADNDFKMDCQLFNYFHSNNPAVFIMNFWNISHYIKDYFNKFFLSADCEMTNK